MHQPLKRGKQMYFTVLKMRKTFHSSYNLFSEKIETPSEEGRQNYCPKVKPH